MNLTSDWHIHSRNSCDSAALTVKRLVRQAAAKGITRYGLTDHLHTRDTLPDIAASRREFLASDPPPDFHFGVEVSSVSQWELDEIATGRHGKPTYGLRSGGPPGAAPALALTAGDIERFGIEYVVGGTHWPLYVPLERQAVIADYHRQNLFLATHPLVDVVAHPWWWHGHWQDDDGLFRREPWFDDFGAIPLTLHDEFAAALIEHGTACEANLGACILNPHYPERWRRRYVAYLAALKEKGVAIAVGSDCHSEDYGADFEAAARMLEEVGFREDDFWHLNARR